MPRFKIRKLRVVTAFLTVDFVKQDEATELLMPTNPNGQCSSHHDLVLVGGGGLISHFCSHQPDTSFTLRVPWLGAIDARAELLFLFAYP